MSSKETTVTAARTDIPQKGWAGFKANWKSDLISGFTVSLIALPLCLGIAKASGFPPIAGLFTAIIGGLFASRLAGSFVTISGPAAGLIVINIAAVCSLGDGTADTLPGAPYAVGYPFALAAILVGGAIVVLFGLLKVGKLGDFFPSAAVHGMLAAIGIIIIIKQLYPALGVKENGTEMTEMIMQIPEAFKLMNPAIVGVALLSLTILVGYQFIKNKYFRMIPAPMWVLLITVPVGYALLHLGDITQLPKIEKGLIDMKAVVALPKNVMDGIVMPNFGKVGTGAFWISVMTIALVSGLESLLSAKAVDALDPWKRKSNLNRDLIAMGGGSALASSIGGLPMISEIVRSSANINNGGRSQWANFFHGAFLLIFLLLLAPIINMIPNAALAAMLIFTGFRLASPKEFKHMYQIDWRQLLVFVITIVVVLLVDLLVGIAAGIVAELFVNLFSGAKLSSFFVAKADASVHGKKATLKIRDSLTFTNYLSIRGKINQLKDPESIILDFSGANYVDHTVMANLTALQAEFKVAGRQLVFQGLDSMKASTSHPLAPRKKMEGSEVGMGQQLSRRQMELMKMAVDHHHHFVPETWDENDQWQGFPTTNGKTIVKVTSVFEKRGKGSHITVGDLRLRSGAMLTLEESDQTMMRIDFTHRVIPEFILTRETKMDKLAEKLGAQDIDFDDFPAFSDHFLLTGNDEAAIRAYFTPEFLRFHEANKDYYVESKGNSVLVYLESGLATAEEIEKLLAFGKEYSALGIAMEASVK